MISQVSHTHAECLLLPWLWRWLPPLLLPAAADVSAMQLHTARMWPAGLTHAAARLKGFGGPADTAAAAAASLDALLGCSWRGYMGADTAAA